MKFVKTHSAKRGTSTYKAENGLVVYVPKSAGEHPAEIEVNGLTAPERAVRAKMTPEERKAKAAEERARVAGLTPAQRSAELVEKRRKALAAAEAKAAKNAA